MQMVLDLLVPGIIAGVSCYGMAKGVDVYDALLQGAAKGLEICGIHAVGSSCTGAVDPCCGRF